MLFSKIALAVFASLLVLLAAPGPGPRLPGAWPVGDLGAVVWAQTPGASPEGGGAQAAEWICPMECGGRRFDGPAQCPECGMDVVPRKRAPSVEGLQEGGFFDAGALLEGAELVQEPAQKALMPGLPRGVFYAGSALVILAGVLGVGLWGGPRRNLRRTARRWDYPRWELTRWPPLARLLRWQGFQPLMQLPVVLVFVLVIVAGLFGSQDPARNLAPVLTWNIWWMGLIFFAFFAGEVWCTVCPWMALPDWGSRLFARFGGRSFGLGLRWPRALQNLYPAIAMFLALTWLELAWEAPYRPAFTALMGLGMVVMASATMFLFEKKGFCRYLCPVGRVTGVYGTTGILELRRRDSDICRSCQTKDCFHGNARGLPCPTGEFMGAMNENSYCTMCTECLKSCPHENIALNLRAPLADLTGPHRRRRDEAWLILVVFLVTLLHGLAMVPWWGEYVVGPGRLALEGLWGEDLGTTGELWAFSLGMAGFLALGSGLYAGACALARALGGNLFYPLRDYLIGFAYPLLPVALTYHLAHNALHFFYEGSKLARLSSDPFGWGWDLFGTAGWPLTMLIPLPWLWGAQMVLMVLGNIAAVALVRREGERMFANRAQALRVVAPMALFMGALCLLCMWLLSQPMEMRTA